jgi:hypothetical protein
MLVGNGKVDGSGVGVDRFMHKSEQFSISNLKMKIQIKRYVIPVSVFYVWIS